MQGTIPRDDGRSWLSYREGSGGTVEIFDLHVDNEHRREGRGRAMVGELLGRMEAGQLLWAVTRPSNLIAQEFYTAMGFRVVGSLVGFYNAAHEHEVDAVIYGRRK